MPGKKLRPILTARLKIDEAIGVSFTNKLKPFHTRCAIVAQFGSEVSTLRKDYYWNGANIPRFFWSLLGIAPTDPRAIIASGFHDDGCERDDVPQVLADALFCSLLGPIIFNGEELPGVGRWGQIACYTAVRFYSIFVRPLSQKFNLGV